MRKVKPLDLDQAVLQYLTDNVELYAPIELGMAYENGNTIGYTTKPDGPGTRYYNGRVRCKYAFTIDAKNQSELVAINQLSLIMQSMRKVAHNAIRSRNGTFEFIRAFTTGTPAHVATVQDTDESGKKQGLYAICRGQFEVEIILNN